MNKVNCLGLIAAVTLVYPTCANADITVKLPLGSDVNEIAVQHYPLSNLVKAQNFEDLGVVEETVPVTNGEAKIITDSKENNYYTISLGEKKNDVVYMAPGDNILIEVASLSPYYSVISGSEIMDGITSFNQEMDGITKEIQEMMANGTQPSTETIDSVRGEIREFFTNFIEENPTSPLVAYALLNLDDKDFENYYSKMSEGAKASILYPFVEKRVQQSKEEKEREQKMERLQSENIPAPDFSLENTYGKKVSLAEFRGKWVILDFWGSWCIWCIKGFPELKEAYNKYSGTLEVIGIDCRESKEAWLAGIKKYELPWVNLYCPDGNPLLKEYGIQGFPTKVIIDPEGKIRDITVGHNPDFFNKLDSLLAK